MGKAAVSIISPAHNEEETIESFVNNSCQFLKKSGIAGEVMIIQNGSRDKTLEKLVRLEGKYPILRVINCDFGNKGRALKIGLQKAKGDYLVTLDTDLWDEDFTAKSLELLSRYDIVVGSKSLKGGKDNRELPARLMNIAYNLLFKLAFGFKGTETHAKLSFNRKKILPVVKLCRTEDLTFDTELLIRAERLGLSKTEIPTSITEVRPRRYNFTNQLIKTGRNILILARAL